MKTRNKALAVGTVAATVSTVSNAALDAGITTAIADATTDVGTVQTAVLGIAVLFLAFKFVKAAFFA